jgi:hypothetical protein
MATSMSPRDGGQYTCFAVVAVIGSQPVDTIEMVPSWERAERRALSHWRIAALSCRSAPFTRIHKRAAPASRRESSSRRPWRRSA